MTHYGDYDEEGSSLGGPNIKWLLLLGLIALGWYLFRMRTDPIEGLFFADIALIGSIVFIAFLKLEDADMKHRTRKFIANGLYTTITNDPAIRIGAYAIFRAGGIDSWGFKWPGGDGSIIAPISCLTNVGECIVANTRMIKVPPNELPDTIREELEKIKYPTPYYYGIPDASQLLNIPEGEELLAEMRLLNKENQMLKRRFRETLSTEESYKEHKKRMAEMDGGSKRGFFEKLFND